MDANIIVGPTFTQQTKSVDSIPDLAITQKSFSVFFETKTTDWFYNDQINRHIKGFNETAGDFHYKCFFSTIDKKQTLLKKQVVACCNQRNTFGTLQQTAKIHRNSQKN